MSPVLKTPPAQQHSTHTTSFPINAGRRLPWAGPRLRLVLLVSGLLLAAVLALLLWFALARPVTVVPRMRPVPAFSLRDQAGQWVLDGDLREKVVLLHFSYSRCGQPCVAQVAELQALRDQLQASGLLGSQVQLLTVSFDPAYDTPAVLNQYAASLGADGVAWRVLTGEATELKTLIGGGFRVFYEQQPGFGGSFAHDQRVTLVDKNGLIRAEYDGERFTAARAVRDITLMEREAQSSGLERSVYEAAHLF
nr:SCO family protein [Chloroflexaceae bacterium]